MSKTAREVIRDELRSCGIIDDANYIGGSEGLTTELLAALDAAGFVIAPKEPTPGMLFVGDLMDTDDIASIYRAITAASAQESKPGGLMDNDDFASICRAITTASAR